MPKVYTKADDAIRASVGKTFTIELEANPTTGYEWQLHFDPSKLQLLEDKYQPGGAGIGAAGLWLYRLRPVASGETEISAEYKRRWEASALEEKRFRVSIED